MFVFPHQRLKILAKPTFLRMENKCDYSFAIILDYSDKLFKNGNDRDSSSTSFSDNLVDQNFTYKTWQIVTHKSFDITINNNYVMQAEDADSKRTTTHKQKNAQ